MCFRISPKITKVTKDSRNTFLMMTNDTTHDVMMLQEPDYTPSQNVDNTDYEAEQPTALRWTDRRCAWRRSCR